MAEFLESCGRPHLEKPFTPDDIRQLVERVQATQ